jgi:hypothetical protein
VRLVAGQTVVVGRRLAGRAGYACSGSGSGSGSGSWSDLLIAAADSPSDIDERGRVRLDAAPFAGGATTDGTYALLRVFVPDNKVR